MDWLQLIGPGLGTVGVVLGGWIAKRKPRVDQHAVIVADATDFGQKMYDRLEEALRRIDSLEDREKRRDDLARQHLRWDWRQVRRLADQGIKVEDPPPLFVYDTLTKEEGGS